VIQVAADKQMRKENCERRLEALSMWKKLEDEHKNKNKEHQEQYCDAVERWKRDKVRV